MVKLLTKYMKSAMKNSTFLCETEVFHKQQNSIKIENVDGWMDEIRMDGWMDRWMDGWMKIDPSIHPSIHHLTFP